MFLATLDNNNTLPVVIISLDHLQPITIYSPAVAIAPQQIRQLQQYQSTLQTNNSITFNNNDPSYVNLSKKGFTNTHATSTQSVSPQSRNNINSQLPIRNINDTHNPITQLSQNIHINNTQKHANDLYNVQLNTTINNTTNQNINNLYQCSVCSKDYKRKANLENHLKIH
eukprot:83483_1